MGTTDWVDATLALTDQKTPSPLCLFFFACAHLKLRRMQQLTSTEENMNSAQPGAHGSRKRLASTMDEQDSSTLSPEGSPTVVGVSQAIRPKTFREIDAHLEQVARVVSRKPYMAKTMQTQRFFLGAVLKVDDADEGHVFFGFSAEILRAYILGKERGSSRTFKHVIVAALDGDHPVESVRNFLAPLGLDAAHKWAVELSEEMDFFLLQRWCHVNKLGKKEGKRRMRAYFLQETLGIREVPPGGVWYKEKTIKD